MITKNFNTKTLAKMAQMPTAELNEIARDLNIEMSYDATNRCWRIVRRADAQMLLDQLTESY